MPRKNSNAESNPTRSLRYCLANSLMRSKSGASHAAPTLPAVMKYVSLRLRTAPAEAKKTLANARAFLVKQFGVSNYARLRTIHIAKPDRPSRPSVAGSGITSKTALSKVMDPPSPGFIADAKTT